MFGERLLFLLAPLIELNQNIPNFAPFQVLIHRQSSTLIDQTVLEQRLLARHIVHGHFEIPTTPVVRCSVGCDAQFMPEFTHH